MKNTLAILSLLAAFFVFAVSIKAAPQSQENNVKVTGRLSDPSGAPVAEVQIIAQPETSSTGRAISVASFADGSYTISLPAGRYRLRFARAGPERRGRRRAQDRSDRNQEEEASRARSTACRRSVNDGSANSASTGSVRRRRQFGCSSIEPGRFG